MATETWPAGQTQGTHTYEAGGDYTITATQSGGFTASTSVTVIEPPAPPTTDLFYTAVYAKNPNTNLYEPVDPSQQMDQYRGHVVVYSIDPLPPGPLDETTLSTILATVDQFLEHGRMVSLGGQSLPLQYYHDQGYGDYAVGQAQVGTGAASVTSTLWSDVAMTDVVWESTVDLTWGTLNAINLSVIDSGNLTLYLVAAYPDGATIDVNWGDGSPVENVTAPTRPAHTYNTAGDFHVTATPSDTSFEALDDTFYVRGGNAAPYGYPATPTSVPSGTSLPVTFHVTLPASWPSQGLTVRDTSYQAVASIVRTGSGVDITVQNWGSAPSGTAFIFFPQFSGQEPGISTTDYMQQVSVVQP